MKPKKSTEKDYARALKKIAKQAAHIVDLHADGAVITYPAKMMAELEKYSAMLEPWADKTAAKMINATKASVERTIKSQSREISRTLRQQINSTPMGVATRAMQSAQVELIKSIPIEAGVRAQNLALSAFTGGRRPSEVAAEIERTEQVTTSRAMLIARTETAKAASIVTEVRAKEVGATHYIWRTAGDSDVRESHAEMEGEVCSYDDPPIVDGEPLNPGMIYNCRCYAEPIIPD
jgi:SPP1 gp7 family putative phage head morphogenesis protein